MWSGNGLGGSVWEWELGDRRVRCLPEVWLQNSPNCIISALLQREYSMVLFSLSYWEILRVFLDWRWRSTHSGLLMRKALRTQKFSRHYSMTFVRFAWDAAARHSCSHGVGHALGSSGLHSGTGSNTREPRYVRNIKTNQALSATPHLRPPLWAAGWACGGNETVLHFGPHRHLHYETLTTTGAPGMSVRYTVRKRKSEMGGKMSVREKERPGSPPNQLKWKLSSSSVCACVCDSCTARGIQRSWRSCAKLCGSFSCCQKALGSQASLQSHREWLNLYSWVIQVSM